MCSLLSAVDNFVWHSVDFGEDFIFARRRMNRRLANPLHFFLSHVKLSWQMKNPADVPLQQSGSNEGGRPCIL